MKLTLAAQLTMPLRRYAVIDAAPASTSITSRKYFDLSHAQALLRHTEQSEGRVAMKKAIIIASRRPEITR